MVLRKIVMNMMILKMIISKMFLLITMIRERASIIKASFPEFWTTTPPPFE